jgi:hypothetical protein
MILFRKLRFHRWLVPILITAMPVAAQAQFGAQLSWASPIGNFGAKFKKSIAAEVYWNPNFYEEKLRGKFGIYYIGLQPRLESFPSWLYIGGSNPVVYPGSVRFDNFHMTLVFIEIDHQLLHVGNFFLFAGTSLGVGIRSMDYIQEYETQFYKIAHVEDYVGDFALRGSAEYKLSAHVGLALGASRHYVFMDKMNFVYNHYNFSLGFNIRITNPQ